MIQLAMRLDAAKALFFDRQRVIGAVDRATRQVLSRFGAHVRTRARTSLRYRKRPSPPGRPPHAHRSMWRRGESPLRAYILFHYDPDRQSVIIGPAATNQHFLDGNGMPTKGTVPSVLEYGGQIRLLEVRYPSGNWYRVNLRRKVRDYERDYPRRVRTVTIEARPFMRPAYHEELKRLPALWANSIKR